MKTRSQHRQIKQASDLGLSITSNTSVDESPDENQVSNNLDQRASSSQLLSNFDSNEPRPHFAPDNPSVDQTASDYLPLYSHLYHVHYGLLLEYNQHNDDLPSQDPQTETCILNCFCPLDAVEWKEWDDIVNEVWSHQLKLLNNQGSIFRGQSHIQYTYKGLKWANNDASLCKDSVRRLVYIKVEQPAIEVVKSLYINQTKIEHDYEVPYKFKKKAIAKYKSINLRQPLITTQDTRIHESHENGLSFASDLHSGSKCTHGVPEPGGMVFNQNTVLVVSTYFPERKLTEYKYQNFTTVCGDIGSDQSIIDVYIRGENNSYDTSVWIDFCDITSTIIQTYSHMVKYGSQYGYTTSERGFIFLHVPYTQPHKVYYHYVNNNIQPGLASELQLDMEADNAELKKSAVVGMITVLKKALEDTEPYFGVTHNDCLKQLKTVFERKIQSAPQTQNTDHQAVELNIESFTSTPNQVSISDDEDEVNIVEQHTSASTTDVQIIVEPSSMGVLEHRSAFFASFHTPLANYCTMACLCSLRERLPLSKSCPNYSLHLSFSKDQKYHPLKLHQISRLFKKQLENGLGGFSKLEGKCGSISQLYKATLYPFGYTFVVKAAWSKHSAKLRFEHRAYTRMSRFQGFKVPVYLGYINFQDEFGISVMENVYIAPMYEMVLMAYGGEAVKNFPKSYHELRVVNQDFERMGIKLEQLTKNDVLSYSYNRVTYINFDKAKFL